MLSPRLFPADPLILPFQPIFVPFCKPLVSRNTATLDGHAGRKILTSFLSSILLLPNYSQSCSSLTAGTPLFSMLRSLRSSSLWKNHIPPNYIPLPLSLFPQPSPFLSVPTAHRSTLCQGPYSHRTCLPSRVGNSNQITDICTAERRSDKDTKTHFQH